MLTIPIEIDRTPQRGWWLTGPASDRLAFGLLLNRIERRWVVARTAFAARDRLRQRRRCAWRVLPRLPDLPPCDPLLHHLRPGHLRRRAYLRDSMNRIALRRADRGMR